MAAAQPAVQQAVLGWVVESRVRWLVDGLDGLSWADRAGVAIVVVSRWAVLRAGSSSEWLVGGGVAGLAAAAPVLRVEGSAG